MFIYLTEKKKKKKFGPGLELGTLGYEARHLPLSYSQVQMPPYGLCG